MKRLILSMRLCKELQRRNFQQIIETKWVTETSVCEASFLGEAAYLIPVIRAEGSNRALPRPFFPSTCAPKLPSSCRRRYRGQ